MARASRSTAPLREKFPNRDQGAAQMRIRDRFFIPPYRSCVHGATGVQAICRK
jgi:hypothetical protein